MKKLKMTTRLLPALALTGLLHLSSPALAQDAPNSAHPGPVHTSLDTIQPHDVEAYVDWFFSKQNEGGHHLRDGKIHKVAEPFYFSILWPECDKLAFDAAVTYKEKSGLAINFSSSEVDVDTISMLIIGINSIDDLKYKLDNLKNTKSLSKTNYDELIEKINEEYTNGYVTGFFIIDAKKEGAMMYIVKNYEHYINFCSQIFPKFYQQFLTNSRISSSEGYISDLDYLFVSALYDQSIQNEESEDSARSKIVTIMNNKLKGY